MAVKKSDLYFSIWASWNELRGCMDARQRRSHSPGYLRALRVYGYPVEARNGEQNASVGRLSSRQ